MFDFIKNHKLSILFIILFFVSTAMYSRNLKNKSNLNGLQRLILDVTLPVSELTSNITSSFYSAIDNYFLLIDTKEENNSLKLEISALNARISAANELAITNERLRKLLDFKKTLKSKVVSAEVISRGASTWLNTIIIDKGMKDGVLPGLAVVTEKGVIGHTIYSTKNYAQVLLVIDKNSAVDVINQRSRARGIAKGIKADLCKIDYVLNKEDVAVDDIIITSGLDGVFQKGLMVGRVIETNKSRHDLFQNATLKPFNDFDKLEEVLIIIRPQELMKEIQSIKENE